MMVRALKVTRVVCCQIINSYLVWGGIGIHYANQYSRIHHQKYVNDFLLSVVRYGGEEVESRPDV